MSIRAKLVSTIMQRTVKRDLSAIKDVTTLRRKADRIAKLSESIPKNVSIKSQSINGVPCEWITPRGIDRNKVLMYLHGGGYVFGGPNTHRQLTSKLAIAAGMAVLLVDYRLAPENRFPAAIDDATSCYLWLLDNGFDSSKIALGGDSAGGGLTVATMINLKSRGVSLPCCAALMSPWLDLSSSGESVQLNAKSDAMLSPYALDVMTQHYLAHEDKEHPLASPLFADLSNLPPILVHVGSGEILLSDSERFINKVNDSGGKAFLKVWPKMPHVFQLFSSMIPESKKSITNLGEFIRHYSQHSAKKAAVVDSVA
jgi:epsilon-lactone hydrolase